MQAVNLFESEDFQVLVHPDEHQVLDPSRATANAAPEAIRNFAIAAALVMMGVLLLFVAGTVADKYMADSAIKKIVLAGIVGFMLGLGYFLWLKIKAVLTSLRKPNLKTPKNTAKSFIKALQKDLTGKAYNLLTDQARVQEKLDLPRETTMQKKMPSVGFSDADSFARFWNSLTFPWNFSETLPSLQQKDIDENTALVDIQILMNRVTPRPDEERNFRARFIIMKRHGLWFIGNGYFWPGLID